MRWFLMLFAVLGVGAPYVTAQTPVVTGSELLSFVRAETSGWVDFLEYPAGGSALYGSLEVHWSNQFLQKALQVYEPSGSALDVGMGLWPRGPPTYYGMSVRGEGMVSVCGGWYMGTRVNWDGTGTPGNVQCQTLEYSLAQSGYAVANYANRTDSWLIGTRNVNRITAPEGISIVQPTVAEHDQHKVNVLDSAVAGGEPTVTELEAEWGIFIGGAYEDGGFGDSWGYGPGTGPGDGDGDGGGTDWQEGQHKTRCDNSGSLNIFEKALFYAFEPCEPWAERFAALGDEAGSKFPLGLTAWFGTGPGGFSFSGGINDAACLGIVGAPRESEGFDLRGGMGWSIPSVEFGSFTFPGVEFCPADTEIGRFWHEYFRQWIYWMTVALFWISILRRVIA